MTAVVQPAGTVTLVFTDIEGSTRLLEELGTEGYRAALGEHRRIVREACSRYDGYEVDTEGDSFFYAFGSAQAAVGAVSDAMQGLAGGPVRVRVGIHTGEPALDPPNYIGMDVHRAARIMAAAHGGQVVLSPSTVALLEPEAAALHDLGEHRLKDLTAPIRLHQLELHGLPHEFPPLKTLYRSNLPVPATPFIGRETELAAVVERLTHSDTRLLTLTGPGGTGKTRLALQAAAQAADHYPDGITWIPLAPLRDPELVLPTIAQALQIREQPGERLDETLAHALSAKRPLLLVDNVEHLLPSIASDLASLLGACPTLTLLVTSRERLQLTAETGWPVSPLSPAEGEQLFLDRAHAAGVDLAPDDTVRALCRRLDELPLAIELAAARTPLLTPHQLLERLAQRLDLFQGARDSDPRQLTLRATVDWSYRLLDPEEQRVHRALSVFAGGCTLAAAEHVVRASVDTLQSLLDKSLLRRRIDGAREPRYWMLETIREHAAERLAACADEDVEIRTRHSDWVRALVEEGSPRFYAMPDAAWVTAVGAEEGNLRVALDRLAAVDGDAYARLCGDAVPFWFFSSHLTDARSRLERACADASSSGIDPPVRVLNALTEVLWRMGDASGAMLAASAEVDLCRRLGDDVLLAEALRSRGNVLQAGKDLAGAEAAFTESADAARRAGHAIGVWGATVNLGSIAIERGDYERGHALSTEAARAAEDQHSRMVGTFNQGLALLGLSRPAEARDLFEEALAIVLGLGFEWTEGLVWPVEALAVVHVAAGDQELAVRAVGAAARARSELRIHEEEPQATMLREALETARSALATETFEELIASGGATPLEAIARELVGASAIGDAAR